MKSNPFNYCLNSHSKPFITKNRNTLRKIEIFNYVTYNIDVMIEEVLDTKSKVKILKFLSKFPNTQFQAIQIARMTKLSVSIVSESLKDLANKGILSSKKISKGYIFEINDNNYLTKLILDLFENENKIINLIANDFVFHVKKLGKIESIVLFGSALRELRFGSDIDFLIVCENYMDREAVSNISSLLTEKYGFTVSSLLMTTIELKRKAKTGEEFVLNVMASHKLLYGKDLEEVVWSEKSEKRKQ